MRNQKRIVLAILAIAAVIGLMPATGEAQVLYGSIMSDTLTTLRRGMGRQAAAGRARIHRLSGRLAAAASGL